MSCTRISLAGGEPLSSKNFWGILNIANEYIAAPSVLTNGTLLTKEVVSRLVNKVNNLQVSVDAYHPEAHDAIRGVKGAWDRTMAGIKRAVGAGIPVGIRITIFKKNIQDALPLMLLAKELGAKSFLARRVVCSGSGIESEKVSPLELKEVFLSLIKKGLEIGLPIGFGDPFPHLLLSPRRMQEAYDNASLLNGEIIGGCSVSIDSMYIAQDGTVLLCPYLPIYCGNVKTQSVKDIWRSSDAYQLARSIRGYLNGKCGRCDLKYACGGCRANAYYETGNICGEDTGCWREI
jgi:radical SAM protein with 4Fe4S-binding SPASM domain